MNSSLTNKEKQVLASTREIIWLKRQIEQLEKDKKTSEEATQDSIPETATDEHVEESLEEYKNHIDTLKTDLDMLFQFNKSKEALLNSVNSQYFTLDALYPSEEANEESKKAIEEYINKRDELVVEFMRTLKVLHRKKNKLTQIQREIMKQHEENREVSQKIKQILENKDTDSSKSESIELVKAINDKRNQQATVRGVLMGIILESGIAWEEDERWLAAMLRIGETFSKV